MSGAAAGCPVAGPIPRRADAKERTSIQFHPTDDAADWSLVCRFRGPAGLCRRHASMTMHATCYRCFAIAEQARAICCDLYGSATDGKLRCHICGESKIAIFAFTLYCNVYVNAATACRTGFPFCRGYRRLKPK
jgi:hypothetical protein